MAFSLAGSVITQTGTDANLSGLSAVAGVTITNFTSSEFITYSCAYRLVVQGTLTIDPEKEIFITSFDPVNATHGGIVRVEGTLNLGAAYGPESTKRYSMNCGICITSSAQAAGGTDTSGRINVVPNGTMNFRSGVKFPNFGEFYAFNNSSNLNITDAFIYCTGSGNFRYRSDTVSVNGLRTNMAQLLYSVPALFKNVNVEGAARAIVSYGPLTGVGSSSTYVVRDYTKNLSTSWDFEYIDGGSAFFYNSANGSDLRVRNWQLGAGNEARTAGWMKSAQETTFTIKNASGVALNAAKVFVRDINNGSRVNINSQNDTADKTYIFTSNGSGVTNTQIVFLAIWNKAATGDLTTNKDVRFNTSDQVTFNFSDYLSNLFSSNFVLRTIGGFNSEVRLATDVNITQTTVATVAAYTSIDDLSRLYDYAKYWRVQDANLEYPSVSTQPVNGNGTTLDLGSRNLIVDATAASAFAINTGTNTITIKASTLSKSAKFTKLTTTGAITFVNGAAPASDLSYQDSSGLRVAINVVGLVANSRLQLYNVSTSTEICNLVVSGASYSQQVIYSTDQTIRYRVMYVSGTSAKKWVEANVTLTSLGATITVTQEDDQVYNSIGIDGSTVSECSISGTSLVININDSDNKTTAQRLLAFEIYWLYTESGMRDQNLYIDYSDAAHLIFLGGLKIKNTKPTPPLSITGASILPETGDPADVIDSSGGSININTDRVVTFTDPTKYLTVKTFLGIK